MNKTFVNGQPLNASDLNQMVSELNTNAAKISALESAVRGVWSICINNSQSSPIMDAVGGDLTSWKIYRQKIGRYFLTTDGKARKLNKSNSLLFEDGSSVDDTQGDIMVRIPKLYYKVVTKSNLVTLYMSESEFDEGCNMIDEQWIGAYLGYMTGGKLHSRRNVNPKRELTINQFFNYAQAKGSNYGLADYKSRQAMMMIYLCEYHNLNSQACLGNGMTGTGNNWCSVVQNAVTGATAELGDDCGKVMFTESGQSVIGACHVSLFGIEDPYGWFWEMIQGCYFGNSENSAQNGTEAFIYEGNRMPTSSELTTAPTGAYRRITRVTTSGWAKNMIFGAKFDVLPYTLGGSDTTYLCDYHYANNTGQLLLWGGPADYGSSCGLSYSASDNAFSLSYSSVGSRLAYYGKVEIVK